MTNITNIKEYSVTGKFDIEASFRENEKTDEIKRVTLRFVLNEVPLVDILTPALSTKRINWQNGYARKNFSIIKDRSIVEVDFAGGKRVKTEEERIAEALQLFMAAGVPKESALEMATKAIRNPEILK